jgi:hypothetical protein
VEIRSKLRVIAKAVRRDTPGGEPLFRSSYRILDTHGEVLETFEGSTDFTDITGAFKEASAFGNERVRAIDDGDD